MRACVPVYPLEVSVHAQFSKHDCVHLCFFSISVNTCACMFAHAWRDMVAVIGWVAPKECGSLHSLKSASDIYCTHTLKTNTCALSPVLVCSSKVWLKHGCHSDGLKQSPTQHYANPFQISLLQFFFFFFKCNYKSLPLIFWVVLYLLSLLTCAVAHK